MAYARSYNPILQPDSYKYSHWKLFPPAMHDSSYYLAPRWSRLGPDVEVVPLGISMWINDVREFFDSTDVKHAKRIVDAHIGPGVFNEQGFDKIRRRGTWPIYLEAVEEGVPVPIGTPLAQMRSVDGFKWVPGFLETDFMRAVYPMTTVATISREMKKKIAKRLMKTQGHLGGIEFMLHDFGARGAASRESAANGGFAHMLSFLGSDTISAIHVYEDHYSDMSVAAEMLPMPIFSIPATEHSVVTPYGESNESDAHETIIDEFLASGKIVASVGDSYDLYRTVSDIVGERLRSKIIASGGKFVIRPDSGVPKVVVPTVLDILGSKFGYNVNQNGYKVLPDCIRGIQGDGIKYYTIDEILDAIVASGWCVSNFAFGMGGGLLQDFDRDTLGFAMKMNACTYRGQDGWSPVQKKPATDPTKASIAGRIENEAFKCVYDGRKLHEDLKHDDEDFVAPTLQTLRERAKL